MADGFAPVVGTDRTYAEVLLGELHPSPTQPRKALVLLRGDEAKLRAFVAHILDTLNVVDGEPFDGAGVRDALRVRRRAEGGFEVVDGECRFHAARLAGLRRVTCEIVVLSDEQVIEEQLVANGARRDLAPLEEAEAFAALRARGLSVEAIADRIGRSVRTIHKRLALVDHLGADGRELLAAGAIHLPLAENLAGLGPEGQARAVADIRRLLERSQAAGEPVASRDVRWALDAARLRLKDGGFPLDDAELVRSAGPCTACPKRSGVQAALFVDGLADGDLCADPACFKSKKEARFVQLKATAKATGVRVVDAAADVKKIFPYGDRLPHDSAFVDLDAPCDLIRPPTSAAKNQGRRGGPEQCSGGDEIEAPEDGKHDFLEGEEWSAAEFLAVGQDLADLPDHMFTTAGVREALKAGCEAFVTCSAGCGAWKEEDAGEGHVPRGWKPPTWREALTSASGPGAPPPRPELVAADPSQRAHELVDKKAAVKLLRQAGAVDEREAARESGNVKAPKKPGELDKFALDREAKEAAVDEGLGVVAAKAAKKAPDLKFWRFLAALCLSSYHNGDELDRVASRRGLEAKGKSDLDQAVKAWVAEEKDEGALRGLVVELLAHGYGEEGGQAIAFRFFNVDVDGLAAAARTRIKAEAKEKAKKAAAKDKGAKPAKKTAKGAAKPKASSSAPAEEAPRGRSGFAGAAAAIGQPSQEWIDAFKPEFDRVAGEVLAFLGADRSPEDLDGEEQIVESLCDDAPEDEQKVRQVLAAMVTKGTLRLEIIGGDRCYGVPKGPAPTLGETAKPPALPGDPETVALAGDARKAAEARACPKCKAKAGKVCVGPRGKLGTGWFHTERWRVSGGPAGAPKAWAPEQTTIPGSGPAPTRPSLLAAAQRGHSVGRLDPPAIPSPKAPPADHAPRKCVGCGCTDGGACQDDHPASEAGECTWEELAGDKPICSVCLRCAQAAIKLCAKRQAPSAVTKALTVAQKGPKAPEVWGKDRVAGVLAHLETTGALGRTVDKKLLAAQPVAG